MPTARAYHAAATVRNRWYVAGGSFALADGGEEFPTEVDIYEPTSAQWTVLGQLAEPGESLGAIADPIGGRVLFPGRLLPDDSGDFAALPTCDVATPDGVQVAPSLLEGRYLYASAFAAGRFIVSGGWSTAPLLGDAEVWNGSALNWTSAGTMPGGPRAGHTMTALRDGRVLVAGGGTSEQALSEADLFDVSCGTWSRTAPLMVARARQKAVLLSDGRVLVAGGFTYPPTANNVLTSVEVFDPSTQTWSLMAPMNEARFDFDMVLLPDGRVLAAGGSNNATLGELGALNSAEVYDPAANEWTVLYPMHDRRRWPTLAVLSDGVYVAGGDYADSAPPGSVTTLATCERLAWSDLGIAGPIQLDAAVPGEYAADASVSCDLVDAGLGPDGGQGRDPADGAVDAGAEASVRDATMHDASVRDAGSSHSGSRGTEGGGCSCAFNPERIDSFVNLAVVWGLGFVLRRRSRRMSSGAETGSSNLVEESGTWAWVGRLDDGGA